MDETEYENILLSSNVKSLANKVYKEFESIVHKYGNESVEKLTPLIVSILTSLEEYENNKDELEINYTVLKEDQNFILSELEKERTAKRSLQEKINKLEDYIEDVKREREDSNVKAYNNLKRMELSNKNLQDQISRYEDRENELKKANEKIHERYCELLKNHAEYIDRMKSMNTNILPDGDNKPTKGLFQTTTVNYIQPKFVLSQPPKFIMNVDDEFDIPNTYNQPVSMRNPSSSSLRMELNSVPQESGESVKQKVIKSILETTPELNAENDLSFSPRNEESNFDDFSISGDVISDGSQDHFGVTREVQNILRENQELIQDRNAFKVALDDIMTQVNLLENENKLIRDELNGHVSANSNLQIRLQDLEQENSSLRRQVDDLQSEIKEQDQENTPWAKKMWFSRSEMSKMIIERNHFKMQLTDLQNKVEWIEMSKAEQRNTKKPANRRGKIAEMFMSMLFGQSPRTESNISSSSTNNTSANNSLRSSSTQRVASSQKSLDQSHSGRTSSSEQNSSSNVNILNPSLIIRKGDEKCNCYHELFSKIGSKDSIIPGWECPSIKGILKHQETSLSMELSNPETSKFSANNVIQKLSSLTAMPIFSRPLNELHPDMEIWCATCTFDETPFNLDREVLRIGHSQFYCSTKENDQSVAPTTSTPNKRQSTVKSNSLHELANTFATGLPDQRTSEVIWICGMTTKPTTLKSNDNQVYDVKSQITIVNMNRPRKFITTFAVFMSQIISMGSAPGFDTQIHEFLQSTNQAWQSVPFSANTSVNIKDDIDSSSLPSDPVPKDSGSVYNDRKPSYSKLFSDTLRQIFSVSRVSLNSKSFNNSTISSSTYATSNSSGPGNFSQETVKEKVPSTKDDSSEGSRNGPSPTDQQIMPKTHQPTVWLGSQCGDLHLHSSVSNYRKPLNIVNLSDSITNIVHFKGRMFISLANSKVYVFRRCIESKKRQLSDDNLPTTTTSPNDDRGLCEDIGTWDLSQAVVMTCGYPQYSVRCMVPIVNMDALWIAYRNFIIVVDSNTFQLQNIIEANPKKDSQIRQMVWIADGVWVSMRRESVIRLFHAFNHQHIQDVDIEASILQTINTSFNMSNFDPDDKEVHLFNKEKADKKTKSLNLQITSLLPSRDQLWIGTNIGITVTLPYSVYIGTEDRIEENISDISSEYANIDLSAEERVQSNPKTLVASHVEPGYLQISRYSHMKEVRFLLQIQAHGPLEAHSALSRHKFSILNNTQQSQIMVISGGEGYQRITKRGCIHHSNNDGTSQDNDFIKTNFLFAWLLPSLAIKET